MRTIGVATVGRSDYGIYRPILREIQSDPALKLQLIAGGMHLSAAHGLTIREIEEDGFPIQDRVETLEASDAPADIATSMGRGVIGFSKVFARVSPDILLVLGDRFEMHSAALAALPFRIPVAHLHGGELTEGAIDNALRHSLTHLSHLHFVAAETYARRLRQMGEEPWRITVSGAPGLDALRLLKRLSREELSQRIGLALDPAPLLVTFHPVTLEWEQTERHITELLKALEASGRPVVFTAPNADTAYRVIFKHIAAYVRAHPNARLIENLGTQAYFSLMEMAAALVGNSSSGIIEAPSIGLPVVNVGNRQKGRVQASNILDVGCSYAEILSGIRQATTPAFREGLKGMSNPYGDGHAAPAIVRRLRETPLDERLLVKRFMDLPEREREYAAH